MTDSRPIQESIDRIVEETVRQHSAALRDSLRHRLGEELPAGPVYAPGASPSDLLNGVLASIQEVSSQADILKTLLDGAIQFSGRCALLVVRGNTATGWQARGFSDNEGVRSFSCDASKGLSGRVSQGRQAAGASVDEFDGAFIEKFGRPLDGNVVLLPLVIKDKVAALIYADGGVVGRPKLERSCLEILVRATGLWLEVLSFRKTSAVEHQSGATEAPVAPQSAQAPPQSFAGTISPPAARKPAAAAGNEVHEKARRFAKLLVEEIKLYNQGKVGEGRANQDLYDRLKDDIDKSRATYEKRYGQSVGESDYFTQELVRILADNDRCALGPNFRW